MTRRLKVLLALILVLPVALFVFTDSDDLPDVVISEVMTSNATTIFDEDGESSDWIELWNRSSSTVDLVGWKLTDGSGDGWEFPRLALDPDERVVIWASGKADRHRLHTDFRLSADGEYLGLHNAAGRAVSEYRDVPALGIDLSFGIGSNNRAGLLLSPTPGEPNPATWPARAGKPTLSRAGGYIDGAVSITARTGTDDAQLWYTTDGSTPAAGHGTLYTGPIEIETSTTLRMVATGDDFSDSFIASATYLLMDEVLAQSGAPAGWPSRPVNEQIYQFGFDQGYIDLNRSQVAAALQAAPTLSITTELENLVDPTTGIYSNSMQSGSAWERPVSLELIDGDSGFQINAGIRVHGGASRDPANSKHAFQLTFGPGYEGRLSYPLFGAEGIQSFATVDLRSEQNHGLRDQFTRDSQAFVGEPSTRDRWVHLFLNGQYWGLYMLREDVTAHHATATWGGSPDDYDVLKHSDDYGYVVAQGDDDEWLQLWQAIADTELTDDEFATVTDNTDLHSLATFMLINIATGNLDATPSVLLDDLRANNWQAVRGNGQLFQFFLDDGESSLGAADHDSSVDRTGPFPIGPDNEFWNADHFNPGWLHQVLLTRPEYRAIVSERAEALLAPDGALAVDASLARWIELRDEVDPLIEVEAARWGYAGAQELGRPEWEAEVAWVETVWFPERTEIVRAQLRADDLLSDQS